MGLSWKDIKDALGWGKTAYDTNEGLNKQELADKNLGDACNDYVDNPTAENRARLRQAHEDWYHTPADNVGNAPNSALPKGLGDLLDLLGINPVGDWLKGLQDSPGNPVATKRLEDALEYLQKRGMSDADRARCEKAGDYFKQSRNYRPPLVRDPLAIDLDGDGIETVSAASGVLFDHDGNGIKTGSGWVGKDDGLLVLDRNGNGLIDNGAELFGVDTVLTNGQKAADGFQALSELDSNGDGRIDAGDIAFQSLRVWRDIDQDGVSQADEMFALADVGVSNISLAKTTLTQDLGNGNQVLATGSFSRTDGTTGIIASLALAEDRFNSEFVDAIPISAEAQALPHMSGMGLVRDLSEAATLSPALLGVLSQYAAATSVYGQKNLLDQLVNAWAGTAVAPSQGVQYEFTGIQHYIDNDPLAGETDAYRTILQKLQVLEIFNADSFAESGVTNVTLLAQQVALINQGYEALKSGIYDSLISQTLLKPYFDAIGFVNTGTPHLEYTGVVTLLDQRIGANPSEGMAELVDLYRLSGGLFQATGWNIGEYFGSAVSTHPVDNALAATLTSYGIVVGGAGNDVMQSIAALPTVFGGDGDDSISGGSENATLYGGDGNDSITDSGGSDAIEGGAGDDVITDQGGGINVLRGGEGNDTINFAYNASNTIDGGTGNDLITSSNTTNANYSVSSNTSTGGAGNDRIVSGSTADTYVFNRGDGQDAINDNGSAVGTSGGVFYAAGTDKIVFGAGITQADLAVSRSGNHLLIKVNDAANPAATDQITIENWFLSDPYRIETFAFADGTSLTTSDLQLGTVGNDALNGTASDSIMMGDAGDDSMFGGDGNDLLSGGIGDDTLDGGAGADTLAGGLGNDTYLLGRGHGSETVQENDATVGNTDLAQFLSGIATDQIWFRQVGNNLEASVIGTSDLFTLQNWYLGSQYHVEQFKTADGKMLLDSQVQNLVSAMAAFAPPAPGQTTLPPAYQDALAPVIAANWQ